jgi:hypothetical protein
MTMERKPNLQENISFNWSEHFIGNWDLFQKVLKNKETIFVYDIDAILADTAEVVLKRFSERTGIKTNSSEIDRWDYLTNLATIHGLGDYEINNAENDWFKSEVLMAAKRLLYIRPVVQKTLNYYGPERNFVLTSRNPNLKASTMDWFTRELPEIKSDNILIRQDGGIDMVNSAKFKVGSLQTLAEKAPWVVFVDDHTGFVKAVLENGIKNCLVVNIPQGKIMPDFSHERLVVIKRYPDEYQAMYPFMYAVFKAINSPMEK